MCASLKQANDHDPDIFHLDHSSLPSRGGDYPVTRGQNVESMLVMGSYHFIYASMASDAGKHTSCDPHSSSVLPEVSRLTVAFW